MATGVRSQRATPAALRAVRACFVDACAEAALASVLQTASSRGRGSYYCVPRSLDHQSIVLGLQSIPQTRGLEGRTHRRRVLRFSHIVARRSLTASATRALDDGVLDTLDRKATAQLRGLGLEPEERKILGSQLDRAMAVQRSRSVILEYQASPAKQTPLADYDEVSAHACREGSRAWLLSRDRARAAQVLAAREHEALFGESLRASTARATRRESAERPRRSIGAPAGGDADAASPGDLGDMIRNDTFNNLAALCRRSSLPRNSPPPQ